MHPARRGTIVNQWEPRDPRRQRPATPPQWGQQAPQEDPWQASRDRYQPAPQPRYEARLPERYEPPRQPSPVVRAARKNTLTAAESFWYVLGCIPMGAMYLCKVPCKKALQDFGMAEMTTAEKFWYVLMCIPMGAGYFCKLPVSKALTEMPQLRAGR
jgi:hypothetical protein